MKKRVYIVAVSVFTFCELLCLILTVLSAIREEWVLFVVYLAGFIYMTRISFSVIDYYFIDSRFGRLEKLLRELNQSKQEKATEKDADKSAET